MAIRRSRRPALLTSSAVSALRPVGAVDNEPIAPSEPRVRGFVAEVRGRSLLAVDLVGIIVAAYVALALRFDRLTGPFTVPAFPVVVCLLIAVRTIVNVRLGLYSRRWRFASVPDLERIVAAVALGSLVAMAIFYGAALAAGTGWPDGLPRSFWLAEALLSLAILGGVRFGIRAASEPATRLRFGSTADRRATLLYGAGQTGVTLAR